MKAFKSGMKWFTAVAVAVAGIGLGGGSLVAPDTAFAKFQVDKLTITGDIRVRGEFDRGLTFNSTTGTSKSGVNHNQIHQRTRLRFNYDVSSDVAVFTELQDSRNWGSDVAGGDVNNLNTNQNDLHGESLGMRQAYLLLRNAGVSGLTLKVGRQKVVIGDQRLLGHFDWNNVGFSLDGVRGDYTSPLAGHILGWFRLSESNCARIDTGNCRGPTQNLTAATLDSDLFIWYNTFKQVPGMTIEPYWYFLVDNRSRGVAQVGVPLADIFSGTTRSGRVAPDQKRHFLGIRVNGKAMRNKMVDYTAEYVYQTGTQKDAVGSPQSIDAYALAIKGGVTLKDVPMKPRFGLEFDIASGSARSDQDSGGKHTFEGLFPTNHLHYGYMDQMAWKNMVNYSGHIKIHPMKVSNLKFAFHILRLQNPGDNWYHAGQGVRGATVATNQAASLGQELDIIYTHKFKQGKVALQLGYGHFFSGEYGKASDNPSGLGGDGSGPGSGGATLGDSDMDWGYVSVVTKF